MLREINGILRQTNLPNESEEYLLKRDELRRAEIDLRKQRERVAAHGVALVGLVSLQRSHWAGINRQRPVPRTLECEECGWRSLSFRHLACRAESRASVGR